MKGMKIFINNNLYHRVGIECLIRSFIVARFCHCVTTLSSVLCVIHNTQLFPFGQTGKAAVKTKFKLKWITHFKINIQFLWSWLTTLHYSSHVGPTNGSLTVSLFACNWLARSRMKYGGKRVFYVMFCSVLRSDCVLLFIYY